MTCLHPRRLGLASTMVLLLVAIPGIGPIQSRAAETTAVVLTIRGAVDQPLPLRLADLEAMPHTTLKAREKNGDEATFDGVALSELIQRAKPHFTEKCCSNAANACLVVRAADGYRVLFAMAEVQTNFTNRPILLAHQRDGKPLLDSQGPLRLIVPDEKLHSRWVRQVKSMEVLFVGGETSP